MILDILQKLGPDKINKNKNSHTRLKLCNNYKKIFEESIQAAMDQGW